MIDRVEDINKKAQQVMLSGLIEKRFCLESRDGVIRAMGVIGQPFLRVGEVLTLLFWRTR